MNKKLKLLSMTFILALLLLVATACSAEQDEITTTAAAPTETETTAPATTETLPSVAEGQPIVTISTKIGDRQLDDMVLALNPQAAPNTVANFIALAQDGYYDGLIFHRIIADFMIQGGDPTGSGMGGPEYTIRGEFESNGFANKLSHQRGVISMARAQDPDSAGSQFFICHQDATFLDGDYAAFGLLIGGTAALDELATTKTGQADRPEQDCTIVAITVDLNGYQLPEVEKIPN